MAFLSSSGLGSAGLDITHTPPPQFTISSNSASNSPTTAPPPSDSLLKPEDRISSAESTGNQDPSTPTQALSPQRSPNLTPTHSRKNSTLLANRPGSYRTVSAVSTPTTNRSTAVRTPGTVTPIHQAGSGRQRGGSFGMATQETLNPHNAADLLRQAMLQK